ncbi:hypothetical protein CHUAL_007633 [Chamberlinius hualienensis]
MDFHFNKFILIFVCGISMIGADDDSHEGYGGYSCDYLLNSVQQQFQRLSDKLNSIEKKVNGNSVEYDLLIQSKTQLKLLNDRMTGLENNIKNMGTQLTNLETVRGTCTNTPAKTEVLVDNPVKIAKLRNLDGMYVSEYTWRVEDIVNKINQAVNGNETVEGPEFYTDSPGYKLKLVFSPNYKMYNYIGVFVGVVPVRREMEQFLPTSLLIQQIRLRCVLLTDLKQMQPLSTIKVFVDSGIMLKSMN